MANSLKFGKESYYVCIFVVVKTRRVFAMHVCDHSAMILLISKSDSAEDF